MKYSRDQKIICKITEQRHEWYSLFEIRKRTYEITKYENMKPPLLRNDLVYPELSYKLVGYAYEVFVELGPGHSEKTYQKA